MVNQQNNTRKTLYTTSNNSLRFIYANIVLANSGRDFITLGIIGAILPGMPTTVFLILAAWAASKGGLRWMRGC